MSMKENLMGYLKNNKIFLDIGSNSAKIIETEKMNKKVKLKKVIVKDGMEVHMKKKEGKNFIGAINEVEKDVNNYFYGKKAEIVFGSKKTQSKIIMLKKAKEKELQKALEMEIEKSFGPKESNEGSMIEHALVGETMGKEVMEEAVLVVVNSAKEMEEMVNQYESKGIKVIDVHPKSESLFKTMRIINESERYKVLLNIGADYSIVNFTIDNVPVYTRTINFGFDYLVNKIQSKINKSENEIKEILIKNGFSKEELEEENVEREDILAELDEMEYKDDYVMAIVEEEQEEKEDNDSKGILEILEENFDNFAIEIERSITFVKQNFKFEIEKMYLCGGVANMKGIEAFFEKSLQMNVEVMRFKSKKIKNSEIEIEGEIGPEYAALIGECLRGMI